MTNNANLKKQVEALQKALQTSADEAKKANELLVTASDKLLAALNQYKDAKALMGNAQMQKLTAAGQELDAGLKAGKDGT